MRRVKVWRYYCDHCKKGGCGKAAMLRHEKHCVRNPDRECRMCTTVGHERQSTEDLIVAASEGVEAIRHLTGGCPACMLSGMFLLKAAHPPGTFDREDLWFDYQAEHAQFWKDYTDAKAEQEWNY